MDTTPHIDALKHQLIAAGGGSERTRALAERLADMLDAAAHVAIVDALSAAAAELSAARGDGDLAVAVEGRDARLVATAARPSVDAAQGDATLVALPSDVRKAAATAASRAGMSLDEWVARVVRDALEPGPRSRRGVAAAAYQGWGPERL